MDLDQEHRLFFVLGLDVDAQHEFVDLFCDLL
jgi:hypothetical protein